MMICLHFQTNINTDIDNLPINFALLQLVGASVPETEGNGNIKHLTKEDLKNYLQAKKCIEELALYLKPFSSSEYADQKILIL
jgi:RING finger/CCCH-type zinc finger protein